MCQRCLLVKVAQASANLSRDPAIYCRTVGILEDIWLQHAAQFHRARRCSVKTELPRPKQLKQGEGHAGIKILGAFVVSEEVRHSTRIKLNFLHPGSAPLVAGIAEAPTSEDN